MDKFKHIRVSRKNGVAVVDLVDPLIFDNLIIFELDDEFSALLDKSDLNRVLVDMRAVKACSTAVINSLHGMKRRLEQRGGQLRLARLSDFVRGELIVLNMDGTVFDAHDSLEGAFASFDQNEWRPTVVRRNGGICITEFTAIAVAAESQRRVFCDITVEARVADAELSPLSDVEVQVEFIGSMNRRRIICTDKNGLLRGVFRDESKNAISKLATCRIALEAQEDLVEETGVDTPVLQPAIGGATMAEFSRLRKSV